MPAIFSWPRAIPPPMRMNTRYQAPSPHRASMISPFLILRYMLTAIPVKIWHRPMTREPMRTIRASSRGENRAGRPVKVVLGSIITAS